MKPSIIFQFAVRVFTPILLLLSLVIFWRGHNLPGGGFIGGLLAAAALSIHALCWSPRATLALMRVDPLTILFGGLGCAVLSALLGPIAGAPFFTGIWVPFPLVEKIGSPVLFDLGVYLVVVGAVTTALFSLLEDDA